MGISFNARRSMGLVDLVANHQQGDLSRSNFGEHPVDFSRLLVAFWRTPVHDMQQQIRASCFLKRRPKRRHQGMRQIANEANRIRQHQLGRTAGRGVRHVKLSGQGVQGRKQLVGSMGPGPGQGIEQGTFSCVGVTHQRYGKGPLAKALASARHSLAFGAINEGAQLTNFVVKHAPVEFDLLFTGPTAKTDPTLLALQVGPPPNETGGLVLHLGQLDLELTFMTARALGKNLEDQPDTLNHLDAPELLKISLLDRGECVVEQDVINLLVDQAIADFGNLPAADKVGRIGSSAVNGDSPGDSNPGRTGQGGKFVQRSLIAPDAPNPDADQKRPPMGLQEIQVASLSCWKFTGRAGTTVEMACLYTICVTVLRNSTTY